MNNNQMLRNYDTMMLIFFLLAQVNILATLH